MIGLYRSKKRGESDPMARSRDNSKNNDAFDALEALSSGKQPSEPAAPAPKPKPAPPQPAEAPEGAAKVRPKRPTAPTPSPAPPTPQAPRPTPPTTTSGRPATPPPVQPKARPVAARPASRPTGQPARAVTASPPQQATAQPVKKRSSAANSALRRKLAAAEKSETFRQTLIPVLITVAAMLLILCTVGLMMIPDEAVVTEGEDHDGWDFSSLSMLNKPWAKWVILAGYPVAVVLAFGAWMFVMQSGRYESLLASVTKEQSS